MSKSLRISFLFLLLMACNQAESRAEKERRNLNTTLSFVEVIWNNKELDKIDQFYSSTFTREMNNIETANSEIEIIASFNIYFTAFPDLLFTIDKITAIDDEVYMDWTISGTNTGIFGDNPATGRKVEINGISRLEFDEKNKINHQSIFYTELSLLQQLGHVLRKPE